MVKLQKYVPVVSKYKPHPEYGDWLYFKKGFAFLPTPDVQTAMNLRRPLIKVGYLLPELKLLVLRLIHDFIHLHRPLINFGKVVSGYLLLYGVNIRRNVGRIKPLNAPLRTDVFLYKGSPCSGISMRPAIFIFQLIAYF